MVVKIYTFVYNKIIDIGNRIVPEPNVADNTVLLILKQIWSMIFVFIFIAPFAGLIHIHYKIMLSLYSDTYDLFLNEEERSNIIMWCKENKLRYYNFIPFHENELLLFVDEVRYFIGFRKQEDAVAFKLRFYD